MWYDTRAFDGWHPIPACLNHKLCLYKYRLSQLLWVFFLGEIGGGEGGDGVDVPHPLLLVMVHCTKVLITLIRGQVFIIYILDRDGEGVGQILLLYVVLNTDFFVGGGGMRVSSSGHLTLLIIFFERGRVGYGGIT